MSATKLQMTQTQRMQENNNALTRRTFLQVIRSAGAGLVLGISFPRDAAAAAQAAAFEPNVFLKIAPDGAVTLVNPRPEMGQGVTTSLPMLIAEELEVDWTKVRVETAKADKKYGPQSVGGSGSVRGSWQPLRTAGAAAREMLIAAAAQQWGVPASECRAENSTVMHAASSRSLSYGALAEAASKLPVPEKPKLKEPSQFRLLGKRVHRVDTPAKVDGSAQFGLDVKVPGMVYAVMARCPVFGGKLARFDAAKAKAFPGVRDVVQVGEAVAVIADNTWAAMRGRNELSLQWNEGENARFDNAAILAQFKAAADKGGVAWRNDGDVAAALTASPKPLNAVYEFPFLSHSPMEPQNCTAHVQKDRVDIWVPTQVPQDVQETVAQIAGVPEPNVHVHFTYLGGGFGRRLMDDYAAEATALSKAIGKPVKLAWSREDDMQHGFYRPSSYHRMSAAIGADGAPAAYRHVVVAPSISHQNFGSVKDGLDTTLAGQTPWCYATPNVRTEYVMSNTHVPAGWWRSVYTSHCGFATECFFDEMAHAAGKDPFEYRRALLAGDRTVPSGRARFSTARLLGVLELAAAKAGWGSALPKGRARGIACYPSFGSYAAHVAEVSVDDGAVRVHRIVAAVDCGMTVNPDTIEAQMEGSVVYALSALKHTINIERGRVVESNFHNFPMWRISEMPVVETHIVASNEAPGGVGEPGVPSVAPAVINAVFAATGKRLRKLPVRPADFE